MDYQKDSGRDELIESENAKERFPLTMASLVSRMKSSLLNVKVSRVVGALLAFILLYIIFRMVRAPRGPGKGPYGAKYGAIGGGHVASPLHPHSIEAQRYMEAMQDTRPTACQAQPPDPSDHTIATNDVSILIHFNEHQFYDAKLTLHSVIVNTDAYDYKEIILLDDGSETIKPDADEHLKQDAFAKVKIFRTDVPEGEAASKFKAAKVAKGSILVFLSTKTIVNKGWLGPLIKAVLQKPSRIATPHVDSFSAGYIFYANKHNLVNVMSLTLGTYYYETQSTDKNDISYVTNPVIRGDAFAMSRVFLEQLGDLDEKIDVGGGEHLELSLRAWLCGGEIKVIPCSRVVTHDALKAIPITNSENIRRITNLWLGRLKSIVYNQAKVTFPLHDDPTSDAAMWLRLRRNYLKETIPQQCHDIDWYLENVGKVLVIPNSLPRHFGTLGDRNGMCIQRNDLFHDPDASADKSQDLEVTQCRPHTYEPKKIIEMTPRGLLMMQDRCIRLAENGHVILGKCSGFDHEQRWDIRPVGQVIIRGQTANCLTHAMERNRNNELVHFLHMEACKDTREQLWTFTEY